MKLYVLGPMSGIPEFNAPAFREAARVLREMGHEVVSPVELDEAEGFDHAAGAVTCPEDEYVGFLARDIAKIAGLVAAGKLDGGVALDGWEASRGAALEVHVLRALGRSVYALRPEWPDLDVIKAPTTYRPPSDENVLEEASRIVAGDRGDDYGHPGDDFERTAGAWRSLFGWDVTASQVALAMVVVKLSRLQETPDKRDSIVDIAGYARTYEMVREREGGSRSYPTTLPPA